MSSLKIELTDGDHVVEVLQINGGDEVVLGELSAGNTSVTVNVFAPQAIVLRESIQASPAKHADVEDAQIVAFHPTVEAVPLEAVE